MNPFLSTFLAAAIIILISIFAYRSFTSVPTNPFSNSAKPISVTAWIPGWQQDEALVSLRQHINQIDKIIILRYSVMSDGTIVPFNNASDDSSIKNLARSNQTPLVAAVANLNPNSSAGEDWSSQVVSSVLNQANLRERHINELIQLANSYDGIIIDYETLEPNQQVEYMNFLQELSTRLSQNNKSLGVTVPPEIQSPYIWKELNQIVDEIHIMAYGQHWPTSTPGPIAGLDWYQDILKSAALNLDPDKAIIGLPTYGYNWSPNEAAQGLTYNRVQAIIQQHNIKVSWDRTSASPHFTYSDNTAREVWFENSQSAAAKIQALQNNNFHQVFLWFLGAEDPDIWAILS
jgi:spore germination protein